MSYVGGEGTGGDSAADVENNIDHQKKPPSIRKLIKKYGFEERSKSDKRRAFDLASGKK